MIFLPSAFIQHNPGNKAGCYVFIQIHRTVWQTKILKSKLQIVINLLHDFSSRRPVFIHLSCVCLHKNLIKIGDVSKRPDQTMIFECPEEAGNPHPVIVCFFCQVYFAIHIKSVDHRINFTYPCKIPSCTSILSQPKVATGRQAARSPAGRNGIFHHRLLSCPCVIIRKIISTQRSIIHSPCIVIANKVIRITFIGIQTEICFASPIVRINRFRQLRTV